MTNENASAGDASPFATVLRFVRDESGVTAIEYGLLAALIVVVASGSIALLGGGTNGMWTKVRNAIAAALP